MGDSRRFSLFARLVAENFPARDWRIADVAGGKGHLQAALWRHEYRRVQSWDTRPKYASGNRARSYRFGRFDFRSAPRDYDLVLGMHPDEATDHIVLYAAKHRVPFVVCPCCVLPSAAPFQAIGYSGWIDHLCKLAEQRRMAVNVTSLPMKGRNEVIIGRPA